MRHDKRHRLLLPAAVAAALVLGTGIAPAWAYFTATSSADGGIPINVTPETDIEETYGARTKHVKISNTGDTPVFVRARVFSTMDVDVSGTGWTKDGDWYYYDKVVPVGGITEDELTVTINFPEGATEGDSYNVIVVYESTPEQYTADGTPSPDWEHTLDRGTEEGGDQ